MGEQQLSSSPLDEEANAPLYATSKPRRWIFTNFKFPRPPPRKRYTWMPTFVFILTFIVIFHLSFSSTFGFSVYPPASEAQMPFGSGGDIDAFPIVFATSHNDEMQAEPLTLALSLGIPCIEVDVWLVDGVLLAGHEPQDLSLYRTLERLYLTPLLDILSKANADTESDKSGKGWNGVFARASKQELMLMIDMKGDGEALWPALLDALRPFRERGWLTTYHYRPAANATGNIADFHDDGSGEFTLGPLRIVGTGNTPIGRVYTQQPARDVFYDAPLVSISDPISISLPPSPNSGSHNITLKKKAEWTPALAPMASSKWLLSSYLSLPPYALPPAMRKSAIKELRRYSEEAHARGIKARWWGSARWPAVVRRRVWEVQREAGVDWMNADDLVDVARFLREEQGKMMKSQRDEADVDVLAPDVS